MAIHCSSTTAASANEEILPRPSKARLLLLIHVHEPVHMLVHMVGLRLVFMWPHLHLFLMPKHRGDMLKWI